MDDTPRQQSLTTSSRIVVIPRCSGMRTTGRLSASRVMTKKQGDMTANLSIITDACMYQTLDGADVNLYSYDNEDRRPLLR